MASVVEEEENLIDVGVRTIEIDGDDFVVEAVVAALVAFEVVARVVEGKVVGIHFTRRHAIASEEVGAIEGRVDMVAEVAVGVEHHAAEVEVDILHIFGKAEEAFCHDCSPVASHAELRHARTI